MNNNIRKVSYEDTDKKILIDIYGEIFEIKNLDNNKIEEIRNTNKELTDIEKNIDSVLGDGAVEKINNKRIEDGHEKMDLQTELGLLGIVFETYANSISNNVLDSVQNTFNNINDKINNYGNRSQRRYNNRRNYRRY